MPVIVVCKKFGSEVTPNPADPFTHFRWLVSDNVTPSTTSYYVGTKELELYETIGGDNVLLDGSRSIVNIDDSYTLNEQDSTQAFDGLYGTDNGWASWMGDGPVWIQVEVDTPITVVEYGVGSNINDYNPYSFSDFTFMGSNNGTDWVTIDSHQDLTTEDWEDSQGDVITVKRFVL